MKNIIVYLILLSIVATPQISAGSIYYIDINNGNDNNNGLSPGTAWKTISKVNDQSFSPGDSILLKRGEVWRENLFVPSSGVIGHPITFGAYGTGANPIINGADLVTNWMYRYYNIWQAACSTEPNQVFFDDVRGTKAASLGAIDAVNEWFWDSNVLYIYHTQDPDGDIVIEAGIRNSCVELGDKNYLIIDGLDLCGGNDTTYRGLLNAYDASGISRHGLEIKNCIIRDTSNSAGIRIYLDHADGTFDNVSIHDNTIYNIDEYNAYAIQMRGAAANKIQAPLLYDNEIYDCYQGIGFTGVDSGLIYENYFHSNNTEADVQIKSNSTDCKVYRNLSLDSYGEFLWVGTSGIDGLDVYYNVIAGMTNLSVFALDQGCQNVRLYNNSVYDSENSVFVIGGGGTVDTGILIKNNIVDAIGATGVNLEWDNSSLFTSDYNCWDENKAFWDGSNRNWTHWVGTLSHDANGLYQDPLMTDPDNDNFTLQPGSPCINTGTDVGLTQDYAGNTVPYGGGVDIGAYESEYVGSSDPLYAEISASLTSGK